MKVCLVVSDFSPRVGGIATFNTHLAQGLAAHSAVERMLVISLYEPHNAEEQISTTLTVRRLQRRNIASTFFAVMRELWRVRSYDVIHSPNVFPAGFFALLIGRYLLRMPVVITCHGTDVLAKNGSRWTRLAKRFTVLHASATTTVSQATRALVAKQYGVQEERFRVIYYALLNQNTSPGTDVRMEYGYASDDCIVLTVANLVRRKGVDDLVRALADMQDLRVKLLVVGDGPERAALESLTKELSLEGRVQFAGRVADTQPFYRAADIFVLASYYRKDEGDIEGLGIVLLEAEQAGIPVIGTRSGGIPEALMDGETGILVGERDTVALARALERLANDPTLRTRMGEKGRAFVQEKFSPAQAIKEYVSLYEKVRYKN